MDRARRIVARVMPAPIAGVIDLLRPSVARTFGGPFNGQERRAEIVRDIFARVKFASVIETGTFRATTALLLRQLTAAPIATVEANPRFYYYSRLRLLRKPGVAVFKGDSARVLKRLANTRPWSLDPAFFYLDAHWLEALPLPDELDVVTHAWRDFVVMIDDFRVPTDPGYTYDDYGPGRVLEPAILHSLAGQAVVVYWPSAPSTRETGARRGCVVLASAGAMDDALRALGTLRRAGSVEAVLSTSEGNIAEPAK
jgi:hypothetical protein